MDSQVEQYANINAFYEKKIKEVMTMFDANFKTNVNLNIEARVDDKKDCVYCCTTLTYSIYKLDNKYKPIRVIFEKKGSTSSDVEIICPATVNTIPAGCPERISDGGIEYERYTFEIPIECEKYDHLMVRRKMTEPGNREWINYYWQSVTPYENVTFSLKCFDGLRIEDYMIFDNKAYYHVDLSDDKTKLDITSSEWLDADTGFCVFITK